MCRRGRFEEALVVWSPIRKGILGREEAVNPRAINAESRSGPDVPAPQIAPLPNLQGLTPPPSAPGSTRRLSTPFFYITRYPGRRAGGGKPVRCRRLTVQCCQRDAG